MVRSFAWIALGICLGLVLPTAVRADESREAPRPMALGFNLDLLPTVLSAANGKLGYAPQVWLGLGHARVRFVGAHLEPPTAFAFAPSGFRNPTTTAFAALLDYTFGSRFDGAWVGSGFEVWMDSIEHDGVAGTARWTSVVFTGGGGYMVLRGRLLPRSVGGVPRRAQSSDGVTRRARLQAISAPRRSVPEGGLDLAYLKGDTSHQASRRAYLLARAARHLGVRAARTQ